MLKTSLLHPHILFALGRSGHGSRVLVADGNFPYATESPTTAERVFLNLRRGVLTVTEILETLVSVIPIEDYAVMEPPDATVPPIFSEFTDILATGTPMERLPRLEFYARARDPRTSLVIASGDDRRFANILLTIGVVDVHDAAVPPLHQAHAAAGAAR